MQEPIGLEGATARQVSEPGLLGNGARRIRLPDRFGARPSVGAGAAAKQVAEDASELIKAEIALAKAEALQGVKAKGTGLGLLAGAGVLGWLGIQGLLITIAIVIAIWLPLWAGALIVTGVLLLGAGVLGLVGKKKLATPVEIETAKQNVEEDVEWTKARLQR